MNRRTGRGDALPSGRSRASMADGDVDVAAPPARKAWVCGEIAVWGGMPKIYCRCGIGGILPWA